MRRGGPRSYYSLGAETHPTEQERGKGMLHPHLERELGRERVARMREEIERDRLEARLTREDRLSRAAALSEQARLAKARISEEPVPHRGMLHRSATFAASLFGLGAR